MPYKFIQYSFSGGVFARSLHGRSDLEKYGMGLAYGDNFFVDYRGGATSRAGFAFCEEINREEVRLVPFMFNREVANTYLAVFTPGRVRFLQDGAYVLEAAKAVTSIVGNTVTSAAHGYAVGNFVQMNGRTYIVGAVTTNTFTTTDFSGAAETPVGSIVQRVYTLPTPFSAGTLAGLRFRQRRDVIRITSLDYEVYDLTRLGHANWTLAAYDEGGSSVDSPTGFVYAGDMTGDAEFKWTVTAVDQEGRETFLSEIASVVSVRDYSADAGRGLFIWDAVAGAKYYNVYRTLIFPKIGDATYGQQLGYIGRAFTPKFIDKNITPDFTQTPIQYYSPFAPGMVQYVEITNKGSGYISAPTVSITGDGTGFTAVAEMLDGEIIAVHILNPGRDYTTATISFSGGDGADAAATAVLTPTTGVNPQVSLYYGQRQWFMGTEQRPMTLHSTRTTDILSFARSQLITAADPIELELDSPELTPILYAESLLENMFVFTDVGVWQVAPNNQAYETTQRTKNGIGRVPPLVVNTDIIYTLPDGSGVMGLRPGQNANVFVDVELSLFSSDYFTLEQEIVAWDFARTPYKMVWAVKADGRLLSFTYIPTQNVYAWAEHSTQGRVLSCAVVNEDGIDRLYIVAKRDAGIFIEVMEHREFATPEDVFSVDCGLKTSLTYPAADITVTEEDSVFTVVATAGVFSVDCVGSHLRCGKGRLLVTERVSATEVLAEAVMPIRARKPQSTAYPEFASGSWSLDVPFSVVSGLKHLRGETVQVLADGSYIGDFVVSADGTVTLDAEFSYVIAGLGYEGRIDTLPPVAGDSVIDDRRKRIVALGLRVVDTRGIWYGTPDHYYELRERTTENYDEATRFISGLTTVSVRADWQSAGQVSVKKIGPSAVSLLGYVIDMELGDDPE